MLELLNLSVLGAIHTAISLVALGAGAVALVRDKAINPVSLLGKVYVIMTVLTCVTGFFIFRHGTVGPPHVLGAITLVVLGIAWVAGNTSVFAKRSPYVEALSYSTTYFFHLIPAVNETATRLPVGAPLAANSEAPGLKIAVGILLILFVIGVTLQVRRMRKNSSQ